MLLITITAVTEKGAVVTFILRLINIGEIDIGHIEIE